MSWVVRTNRDNPARGGGFREDPEYTSEATGAERQALSRCSRGFTQLSVDMATAPRALRSVTFTYDRTTGRWGVVVVGSGGEYGSAGTIQVVLAPGGLPLVEVAAQVLGWLECGPLLSPARLGAPGLGPLRGGPGTGGPGVDGPGTGGPGVDGRALARTLATLLGMDERARHTLLDVPGAEDEQALVVLMGTVPEELARMVQWSTAYPYPDRNPGNKVVTCLWAAELADRHPREYDLVMGTTRLVAPSVPLSEVPRSLLWYADLVCGARPGTDSVRQRADSLFRARLKDLAPGAAEWEQAVATWQAVLEQLRPLGNDELLVVLNGAEVPRYVSGRWDDAAAARLIRLRRDRLRDLLTHPHEAVRASVWRVVAAEKALYPDLVAWQADLVEAGQPAPPEAAALVRDRSECSLVVDVLAEVAARQGTSTSWRPHAVAWIKSLGLDPRSYEGELPASVVPAQRPQAPTGPPGRSQDGRDEGLAPVFPQPAPVTVPGPPQERRRYWNMGLGVWLLGLSGILNIVLLVVVVVLLLG